MLPWRRVWRGLRDDSWTETSGLYSNSAERYGLDAIAEAGDHRTALRDGGLHQRQRERRVVTRLTVPDLRNPEGTVIGWIACDHVTEAAGHRLRAVEKDRREGVPLSWHRVHLTDQAVHVAPPGPLSEAWVSVFRAAIERVIESMTYRTGSFLSRFSVGPCFGSPRTALPSVGGTQTRTGRRAADPGVTPARTRRRDGRSYGGRPPRCPRRQLLPQRLRNAGSSHVNAPGRCGLSRSPARSAPTPRRRLRKRWRAPR